MKYNIRIFQIFMIAGLVSVFGIKGYAQQNGLISKTIETKEGKINIYLPNLSSGDKISGTVVTEPAGKSSKEITKNTNVLKLYSISLSGQSIPVQPGNFSLVLPKVNQATMLPLEFKNNKGEIVKQEQLAIAGTAQAVPAFLVPRYIVNGEPLLIKGAFDGNASTTTVKINGQKAEVLAESITGIFLNTPVNLSGKTQVVCTENQKTETAETNILNLELSAGKTNLRKNETTELTIKVSGLQGLDEKVPLSIQNTSPAVITLSGGAMQRLTLQPATDAASGVFTTTRNIVSIKTGSFSINVNIPPYGSSNNALCNCYINGQTYLLPPQICNSSGGNCNSPAATPSLPEENSSLANAAPQITLNQPQLNTETGMVNCNINAPDNNVAAVIFSEKTPGSENWNLVGYAVNTGNNWQTNWTAPLGNDGLHIIRARVAGKNDVVAERFSQINLSLTPEMLNPATGENITLTVSENQVKNADKKAQDLADSIRSTQERIDALQKKYEQFLTQEKENRTKAQELATIDRTLDPIPGIYRDSLKKLTDSLQKLKAGLPAKVDAAALQQAADDAAQRVKDCEDRLKKLKEEKEKLEKEKEDQKDKIEDLLKQMDQLHLGNDWIGGHGYHSNGDFWYGYVGDERSNTNISAEANALKNKLKDAKRPYNDANNRLNNCNKEIAEAGEECDKLKKAEETASQAAKDGNQYSSAANQVDELCRQIADLLSALSDWCAANPGVFDFTDDLNELKTASPRTPEELSDYLAKFDDIIKQKQQKEADLNNEATENADAAGATADDIKNAEDKKGQLEQDQKEKQAEAENLRRDREKQLEAEREKQRKAEAEKNAKQNTPTPKPNLSEPVNPSDDQLKFQAQRIFRNLYRDFLVEKGPCDCRTKAIALANNTNTIVTDIIGRIGVSVAFAPLEAFPGLSLASKLGLGAAKAIGSALYGGENFSEELAKNLFNVIGGEIFPKLTGDDFTGGKLNELASGGLDAIMQDEGIRSISWEGETEIRNCGKVKGKTTTLFNPNTGWVTILIKIDKCPLVVIKYKVNKDGVAITKPTVTTVRG